MNVFCIPSWYPSKSNPIYGIFIKEEIELLARYQEDLNFGVSFWGQGDDPSLLWAGQPVRSLKKLFNHLEKEKIEVRPNMVEYRNPTYIWTRKILRGNLKNVFKVNHENFKEFWKDFGGIDLIHVQASYPGVLMASCLSNRYSVPYILTSHMSPFPFREFLKKSEIVPWLKSPIEGAFKVISTSRSAETNINSYGIERTTVIPIARNLDDFHLKKITPHHIPRILAVGRLVEQKGFDILIKALADITDDYVLHIVGDGPEKEWLKELAELLDLSENIVWRGELNRQELIKEMQECSFFVLPSRHETFGNVVVEAAACGKPVIATRCGGPEDIVTEEIGLLVEKENKYSLIEGIGLMLKNYAAYDPELIRKNIESRFHPKDITSRIRRVYEEANSH